MKERTARLPSIPEGSARGSLRVVPSRAEVKTAPQASRSAGPHRAGQKAEGIEVQEQELGQITAQCMYRMRCECGRPWFELELPRLVKCPKCHRLNLVSI